LNLEGIWCWAVHSREECCVAKVPSTSPSIKPTEDCNAAVDSNDVESAINCYQAAIASLQEEFDLLQERVSDTEQQTNDICQESLATVQTILSDQCP